MTRRLIVLTASAALAAASSGSALAAGSSGQQVSMCAQMHLGQRANAPALTCTHEGMTMTWATFGEMVQHMREM